MLKNKMADLCRWLVLLCGVAGFLLSPTLAEICTDDVCDYHFEIRHARSMTYQTPTDAYHVTQDDNGFRLLGNDWHLDGVDDLVGTYVNDSDVLSVDGFSRNVILINEGFPGPTIEVMEGSQVGMTIWRYLK